MIKKIIFLCIIPAIFLLLPGCKKPMIVAAGLSWDHEVSTMNWNDAMAYCSRKGMRLPAIHELASGFKSGEGELLSMKNPFWSSTVFDGDTSFAQVVHFGTGEIFNYNKSYDYYLRCVREP